LKFDQGYIVDTSNARDSEELLRSAEYEYNMNHNNTLRNEDKQYFGEFVEKFANLKLYEYLLRRGQQIRTESEDLNGLGSILMGAGIMTQERDVLELVEKVWQYG
jgi:hypothetical protein